MTINLSPATRTTRAPKAPGAGITDLRIEHFGRFAGGAVCWNDGGFRHHFWLQAYDEAVREAAATQARTGRPAPLDFPVYRNLPLDHPDSRRAHTRQLDSTRGYCTKVLPAILPALPALIEAAQREAQGAQRDEAARVAAAQRAARIRDAGPDLLMAARAVLEAWESGDLAGAVRELAAVVADAEGGE